MKNLKLPQLEFTLKSSEGSFHNFKKKIVKVTQYLEQKEKSVGTNSDAFLSTYKFVKNGIMLQKKSVNEIVNTQREIRALAKLLSESKIKITIADLNHLTTLSQRPSLLLISALTSYFFRYYDKLSPITPAELGGWLQTAYKKRGKKLSSNDNKLFSERVTSWLLQKIIKNNNSLDVIIGEENLSNYKNTRFYELLQMEYYIKQLHDLPANSDSPILNEIINPKVYQVPYKNNQQLGHKILEILIDKIDGEVTKRWQEVVIKIAGDPRVPKDASNYRNWWLVLGIERIVKVRSWLSKVDIELFLKVFDEYANYKRNEDMMRMYHARKIFLLGLLRQKKVFNTMLYLSSSIQNFLKFKIDAGDSIPTNTTLKGADMAIIYLNLGNGISMIEGTHSFKCHLYKNISSDAVVYNYSALEVQKYSLMNLPNTQLNAISHQGLWQKKVINQLQNWSIDINPETVLSKPDYREYKSRYGISSISPTSQQKTDLVFKICKNCGEIKDKSKFYPSSKQSDGLTAWCIDCLNINLN